MSVAENFAHVVALLVVVNTISMALPLVRHRFRFYPLAFILSGFAYLLLLLAVVVVLGDQTVSVYSVNSKGEVKPPVTVPFDMTTFSQLSMTMTSWMLASVLAMLCWMYHHCRHGWHIYIVPMLRDLNTLEEECWASAASLRERSVPSVS